MKKFLTLIFRAYQEFKNLCDPASEGDPYRRKRINWSNKTYFSHRRYIIQKN